MRACLWKRNWRGEILQKVIRNPCSGTTSLKNPNKVIVNPSFHMEESLAAGQFFSVFRRSGSQMKSSFHCDNETFKPASYIRYTLSLKYTVEHEKNLYFATCHRLNIKVPKLNVCFAWGQNSEISNPFEFAKYRFWTVNVVCFFKLPFILPNLIAIKEKFVENAWSARELQKCHKLLLLNAGVHFAQQISFKAMEFKEIVFFSFRVPRRTCSR